MAYFEDHPKTWESDTNPYTCLAQLIISCQKELKIAVEFIDTKNDNQKQSA